MRAGLNVVVVGAGLIGLFASYYLQRAGAKVTVVEQRSVANNVPGVWLDQVVDMAVTTTRPTSLTLRGADLLPELMGGLGYSLEGIRPEKDLPLGGVSRVDAPSLLKTLLWELADYLKCNGARVIELVSAVELITEGARVVGVSTSEADFSADEVVIAAGLGSQGLLTPLGINLGLKIGSKWDFPSPSSSRVRRYVAINPQGTPIVSRPEGWGGSVIAVGHGSDPLAALAVGEAVAAMICADA